MKWDLLFFFNSVLLGVGLAMDAFSVSLANGLNEPEMTRGKMCKIAGVFAVFQSVMPMLGWVCVHTMVQYFQALEKLVPWAALLIQGVATSIDALSVGFTVAEYGPDMVLVSVLIIAAVTFIICIMGLVLGRKFGTRLANKAAVLGGAILIVIGLEIFITGIF